MLDANLKMLRRELAKLITANRKSLEMADRMQGGKCWTSRAKARDKQFEITRRTACVVLGLHE